MSRLGEKMKSLWRKRRAVTPADAAEIEDWLNEGGALHPDGPPTVADTATRRPEDGERRGE